MINQLSAISSQSRKHIVDSTKDSRQETVDSKQGRKSLSTAYSLLFTKKGLLSTKAGFSLVELMITMVVFVFVIAAASQVFTGLLTQFKQQSKIAETNIEGIVGLEILRRDIEHAGYGLPWDIGGATYSEALDDGSTDQNEISYNDSTSNPPRALVSGDGEGSGGSDVLVVKAVNIATNAASSKWTNLFNGNTVTEWTPNTERLETSDRVIVLRTDENRTLVVSGGSFTTRYRAGTDPDSLFDAGFAPPDNTETRVVYGVTIKASPVDTALTMPFNRADFYIKTPTANFPSRCATGTGILYKGTISQDDGSNTPGAIGQELPLLDCVADMQVVFGVDTTATPDGQIDCYYNNLSSAFVTVNAQNIRERVKEVRVYILSQEGQIDRNFTINLTALNAGLNPAITGATYIRVGEGLPLVVCDGGGIAGQDFNLSPITDYLNYRWKVYTLVVKPIDLR